MSTVTIDAAGDTTAILQTFRAELRDPAKPLSLLARFTVESADGAKVEAAFRRARSLTLNEPGCVAFDLNRDPRHPGRFVVYEQWRMLVDLEAHFRTDHFAKLRNELNEIIIGTPEFQVLLPVA